MRTAKRILIFLYFSLLMSTPPASVSAQSVSPKEIVELFMEVYGTPRMEAILPYTSPPFRKDMSPEVWLERTQSVLYRLHYVRLEGRIKSVTVNGDRGTVVVQSLIDTRANKARQTEVYLLRLTPEGWKIVDLKLEDEVIIESHRTETG